MTIAEKGIKSIYIYIYIYIYIQVMHCRLNSSDPSISDQSAPESNFNYGKEAKLLLGLIKVFIYRCYVYCTCLYICHPVSTLTYIYLNSWFTVNILHYLPLNFIVEAKELCVHKFLPSNGSSFLFFMWFLRLLNHR